MMVVVIPKIPLPKSAVFFEHIKVVPSRNEGIDKLVGASVFSCRKTVQTQKKGGSFRFDSF